MDLEKIFGDMPGPVREVVISFHNEQSAGDESDTMDFVTDGLYSYKDGKGKLMYFESEVTGLPGTRTNIEFTPDTVILDRHGVFTSTMVFSEGSVHPLQYSTPYGTADMSIRTRHISQHMDEQGGDISIDYILKFDTAGSLSNRCSLNIRPQ